jgi:hypothetical protein
LEEFLEVFHDLTVPVVRNNSLYIPFLERNAVMARLFSVVGVASSKS